jgi:hypothetical protein
MIDRAHIQIRFTTAIDGSNGGEGMISLPGSFGALYWQRGSNDVGAIALFMIGIVRPLQVSHLTAIIFEFDIKGLANASIFSFQSPDPLMHLADFLMSFGFRQAVSDLSDTLFKTVPLPGDDPIFFGLFGLTFYEDQPVCKLLYPTLKIGIGNVIQIAGAGKFY